MELFILGFMTPFIILGLICGISEYKGKWPVKILRFIGTLLVIALIFTLAIFCIVGGATLAEQFK
jgi:hypothetical protein